MENDHIKDAEDWLRSASGMIDNNPRVACAQTAHALIKALDALFEAKLGKTPTRHDNATDFFKELLSKNLIGSEESRYFNTIQNILQKKSSAEYHVKYFSKSTARKWVSDIEDIIKMVRKYL